MRKKSTVPAAKSTGHEYPRLSLHTRQQGVVLIIALLLLIVISLLAVTSMKNVGTSESIAGNVRTTELATQAAEIALLHCEKSVVAIKKIAGGDTTSSEATYPTTFASTDIKAVVPASPLWADVPGVWDSTPAQPFVLPLELVNQALLVTTYKRPPECLVEPLPMIPTGGSTLSNDLSYVITARGFGPEVPLSNTREKPNGTEIWLQSTISFQ
jgi:type IV pilus assembly protein PilX